MSLKNHEFTKEIISILDKNHNDHGDELLKQSSLLQYLNIKTKAANRGSKSRAGFANHYAIYVLMEDYISKGFHNSQNYSDYEGAQFSALFKRQRELPFGSKLQNHALNHRLNEEFKKYFPSLDLLPIIRDTQNNRYWFNENLITITVGDDSFQIAESIIEIIQKYVDTRMSSFNSFMDECAELVKIKDIEPEKSIEFIKNLLRPNVDARIFEIVSYAVLKQYYSEKIIYWGWSPDELNEELLVLYKTGRTNANDGGIDFVMKPLGRFFQVTETVDAGKYFLDIDKVQRYPITFVVKSEESVERIRARIQEQAESKYKIRKIVDRYVECIEEIINTSMLLDIFEGAVKSGKLEEVISEIVLQSRVEFNVEEEGGDNLAFGNSVEIDDITQEELI